MPAYCVGPGKVNAVATGFALTVTLSEGASAKALRMRICALVLLLPDLPHPVSATQTRHNAASRIRWIGMSTPGLCEAVAGIAEFFKACFERRILALCVPICRRSGLFDQGLETFGYFTKASNIARDEPFGIECGTIVGATQRQPAKKNEIGGIDECRCGGLVGVKGFEPSTSTSRT